MTTQLEPTLGTSLDASQGAIPRPNTDVAPSRHSRRDLSMGPIVSVGSRLRRARKAAGLTQAEVADGMVSAAYVSRIESGSRIPSRRVLEHLADRVHVPVDDLIAEDQAVHWSRLGLADVQICLMRGDIAGARAASAMLHGTSEALITGGTTTDALAKVEAVLALEEGRLVDARDRLENLVDGLPTAPSGLAILSALCRCYMGLGLPIRAVEMARRVARDLAELGLRELPEAITAVHTARSALMAVGESAEADAMLELVLNSGSDSQGADVAVVEDLIRASEYEARLERIAEAAGYAERASELLEHLRYKALLADLTRSQGGS